VGFEALQIACNICIFELVIVEYFEFLV